MDTNIITDFIFLIFLLVFSIFTSLTEASLIAVNRNKLKQKSIEGSRTSKQVLKILENPEQFFGTVLVVNTIANLFAASLATALAINLFGMEQKAVAVATIVITTLVIIIEVTSKTVAVKRPLRVSLAVAYPVRILIWIFIPVVWVFTLITRLIVKLFGISFKESKSLVAEEEIKALIRIGEEEGSIAREEGQLLQKVFRYGDMTVREAMTPISDMVALNLKASYEEIMKFVVESGYSRLPVYDGNPENIVGIATVKDLLSFWEHRALIILQDVMDVPSFIPASKKLSEQLKEFQRGKSHMAIVVDDHGKKIGLMTLEDIIEEIVGEIEDEYDSRFTEIEQISPGIYATSGYCRLQKVNEILELSLPAKDFVTLNGFLIHTLGHVPKPAELIQGGGVVFVPQKIEGHRIIRVEIHKKV